MQISRRDALATGAAALTTAAVTAPLAVKAALGDVIPTVDPVLAVEQKWRAFREYIHNYPDESDAAPDQPSDRPREMAVNIYDTPAALRGPLSGKSRRRGATR